ncbi:glutaredoxin 3 [Nematocida displodere]|uniref:Glutaredoxin 3 n=1 Tax=Nematocida displodere TaxID=1805483 RepID=A0A177ED86_9MICR|nr:glutaredoxin 3 [Nematocida displodere]
MLVSREVQNKLVDMIGASNIFLAIKTTCPWCTKIQTALKEIGLLEQATIISEQSPLLPGVREMVANTYKFMTVPILFVKGRFVGGYSDFVSLKGEIVSKYQALSMLAKQDIMTQCGQWVGNCATSTNELKQDL